MTQTSDTDSDSDLMMRVRDGDVALLGELFERHHVRLFNFFLRLTGHRQVSEDLVQEAFARMLRYRHTFRGHGSFVSWMYNVGRNVSADHFRKHLKEPLVDKEPEPNDSPTPAGLLEELEREESVDRVRRALLELPLDKREVLVLSRYQLLKYDEIADMLGCTVGAVKVRVHRAIKQLREAYLRLEAGEATV